MTGRWFVAAPRRDVYAIISDFEAMPQNFPSVARAMKIVRRDGPHLSIEATSASFGRFFPSAKIEIAAELLPGEGYRCRTHNLTFNTTGQEELRLVDHDGGTQIDLHLLRNSPVEFPNTRLRLARTVVGPTVLEAQFRRSTPRAHGKDRSRVCGSRRAIDDARRERQGTERRGRSRLRSEDDRGGSRRVDLSSASTR